MRARLDLGIIVDLLEVVVGLEVFKGFRAKLRSRR